jgi:hypothetical protein
VNQRYRLRALYLWLALTPFRLGFSAVRAKGALAWVPHKNALQQGERKTCRLLRFK